MDSFQIDMELLRRVGDVRNALQSLDADVEAGREALQNALTSVQQQAGDGNPDLASLLTVFRSGVEEVESDQVTATSRFATGALSVCEALEEYLISLDTPNGDQLLEQAGFTLFLTLGRDPEEWTGRAGPAGTLERAEEGETAGVSDPVAEADTEEIPDSVEQTETAGPSGLAKEPELENEGDFVGLNELAGYVVRLDSRNRSHAAGLYERIKNLLDQGNFPVPVRDLLAESRDILEEITTPPRVRKALREEAMQKVSARVEQALFEWEEAEANAEFMEAMQENVEDPNTAPAEEAPRAAADEVPVEEVEGAAETAELEITGLEAEAVHPDDQDASPTDETTAPPSSSGSDFPTEEPLPPTADKDLLADFITEGLEYLESAEEALLALEADPSDEEAVNVVFRAFHTIKGVSGFLDLKRVSELAHHAESVLSQVRDGALRYSGSVADLSLRSADVLKALLNSTREAMDGGSIRIPASYGSLFTVLTDPRLVDQLSSGSSELRLEATAAEAEEDAEAEATAAERKGPSGQRSSSAEASVRVRTDRLDSLVDMVGELVIAHSMLAQDPVILRDGAELAKKVDHTAKILRELQDLSTGLRMVPLKPAFRKVARVVRDLSRKSGKLVHFVTDGEDTEIDRTMVDIIGDPLVHMVRNSIDHGLEAPEEREHKGKTREGTVRISAYQAGGNVVVEISDDGRGLDRDKILAKARERGIVDSDRGMTDGEIYQLIFAAGFSTAEKVTEISGRGVGMDVVRRNVESLRGRVTIDSKPGKGSVFKIHLPLTLAITDGMLIRVGNDRYIIPTVKIHMSFRPEPTAISRVAGRGEMVLLHNDLLPVVRLHQLFGIRDAIEDPTEGLLVIIGEGSRRSALLVDELVTQQQFVMKALSGIVSNTSGVAGGAILGNGDVGLILDTEEIISLARGEARSAA